MFDPSPIHLVLLMVVVLLIFGSKRLPEVGRSLGRGINEFKSSVSGDGPNDTHLAPPVPTATVQTGPIAAEAALSHLGHDEAIAAQQATPAPTPEIAVVEETERERSVS